MQTASQAVLSTKWLRKGASFAALAFVGLACSGIALAQTTANSQQAKDAKQVPVIDGGAGPCSATFTVTDDKGKPAYAAAIKVHIAYGFMGSHRLDLQASTNFDGKAKFTGLPVKVKGNTLNFQASLNGLAGAAIVNPAKDCAATVGIALSKQ